VAEPDLPEELLPRPPEVLPEDFDDEDELLELPAAVVLLFAADDLPAEALLLADVPLGALPARGALLPVLLLLRDLSEAVSSSISFRVTLSPVEPRFEVPDPFEDRAGGSL
jgi:hypothetical protein